MQIRHGLLQLDVFQGAPKEMVVVFAKWIQIFPHRSGKENWILWNNGNLGAEVVQTNAFDFNSVDIDPSVRFRQAEKCGDQGRFSSASSSNTPNLMDFIKIIKKNYWKKHSFENYLFLAVYEARNVLQNGQVGFAIAETHLIKFDVSFLRPFRWWFLV